MKLPHTSRKRKGLADVVNSCVLGRGYGRAIQVGQSREPKIEGRTKAGDRIAASGQNADQSHAHDRIGFGFRLSDLIRSSAFGVRLFLFGARPEPRPTNVVDV